MNRLPGMLSSRLTSEVGEEEDDDDDPDDDVDNEVKAAEVLYFRLWATVGVPSVPPLVWRIGSLTGHPLTWAIPDGSGMSL